MNSESEKRLFSSVLSTNSDRDTPIPDYPRLNKKLVQEVSKTFAKVIYESIRNDNLSSKNNRDAVISLLSKWSRNNSDTHLNINSQNRNVVIKYLNSLNDDKTDPLLSDFLKEALLQQTKPNLWDDIFKTFERMNEISIEQKNHKELIYALDMKKLKEKGFICSTSTKIAPKNEFDKSMKLLKSIVGDEVQKVNIGSSKKQDIVRNYKNSVALGYALLNMEQNVENQELFSKILNDLLNKSELSSEEIEFLKYLWIDEKNLNLPLDITKKIINSCSFLYEKPLLEIASEIMSHEESDLRKLFTESSLSSILRCIKENKLLFFNVKNCLYEIYSLSNYDNRIKKMLLFFDIYCTVY